jgi:hypothetical protein
MSDGVEKPLYIVFRNSAGDFLRGHTALPKHSAVVFGVPEDAIRHARRYAKINGESVSQYRVLEFEFSGKILEVPVK